MEGSEEDVNLGADKYSDAHPLGTSAQIRGADYTEARAVPLFEPSELGSWSFYRAGIAEFMATFAFLYVSVLAVMGVSRSPDKCTTIGAQGIAWAFGGMTFALVYSTAGVSGNILILLFHRHGRLYICRGYECAGGHINPAVTFGLLLARKLSLTRAIYYMTMQCLGAICGAGVVKGFQAGLYQRLGGGANVVANGYTKGEGLLAEIVGTFLLVYTVFSAKDAKRRARDSSVPVSSLFLHRQTI